MSGLTATPETSGNPIMMMTVHCLLVWTLALVILPGKWRAARGVARVQLRYVAWAFILWGLGAMTTNLVLPWLTGRSDYSWFGPYFGVVLIALIAHTIIRHRLMDLRLVIHQGLVAAIAAILALVPVGVLAVLVWPRLAERLGVGEFLIVFGAVLAAGLISPLARDGATKLLDRYVYRTHANYQRTVREAINMLTRVLNMEELLGVLTGTLRQATQPEGLAVYAAEHARLSRVASDRLAGGIRFEAPDELPGELREALTRTKEALAVDHFAADPSVSSQGRPVLARLQALNWSVVLPLLAEDALVGAIAIGPKRSGDPFYGEDLALLTTLANQAGVALKNAQRYADVVIAHQYIARIVASISSGVVAVNLSEHITLFNEAAAELTGLVHHDMDGRPVDGLPEPLAEALTIAVRKGEVVRVPEIALANGKATRPVFLTAAPLLNLSGAIVGAVTVFSDLTPVKQLETERRKAEKLAYFEMLASGVTHEIKNPLVPIKIFAELVPRRLADEAWVENFGRITAREIDRIERLLERLLTLGQPGERPHARIDLRTPIAEVVEFFQPTCAENGIQLGLQLPAEAVMVIADHDSLKQLVLNLLINAYEATPSAGVIRTAVECGPTLAVVTVSDTGDGIPSNLLERIFDPFMTTKRGGTGLGLTISAGMAMMHGGTLAAANNPGAGACFTLTLPLAAAAPIVAMP